MSRPEVVVFWGGCDAAVTAEARHEVGSGYFVWRCATGFVRYDEHTSLFMEDYVGNLFFGVLLL